MKTIRNLEYVDRPGGALCLDLHLPENAAGPVPVIVGLPGGGWRQCAKEVVPTYLAEHGFALACINYRVSSVAIAPAALYDGKAAVRWLRANATRHELDPARVGVYGGSAGGHLAVLLGVTSGRKELEEDGADNAAPSSAVQAVCAACAPSDLTRIAIPEIRAQFPLLYDVTSQFLDGPVEQRTELARLMSPLTYASPECPPIFLIHGDADDVVPIEESLIFHAAL